MRNKRQWGIAFFSILLAFCAACGGQAKATTMQLARSEGTVGVSDEKGTSVEPTENLNLYSGYQMETGTKSYAWINLDRVKLTKMDEGSQAEILKSGGQLEISLHAGSLFFHVTEPLGEEETFDIRTSSIIVGIRGTCGWVEAADASHVRVYILEGTIECSAADAGAGAVPVSGGQMAEIVDGQIAVSPFDESQLPFFVQEELKQDEALCEKIYDASGLEVGTRKESGASSQESSEEVKEPEEEPSSEEASAVSEGETSAEEDDFREGIWIPDKAEWNGDYNTPMAVLAMVEEDIEMPSADMDWEDTINTGPVKYRTVEAGIWCYGDVTPQLSEARYGEMAAFNEEGYEWRILTWGGVGDPGDIDGYMGLLVYENGFWGAAVQDSRDWNKKEDVYYYAEDEETETILECYNEYSFTVTSGGTDYTEGKLLQIATIEASVDRHASAILVRVPAGYEGTIRLEICGNEEEDGQFIVNKEEMAKFLY